MKQDQNLFSVDKIEFLRHQNRIEQSIILCTEIIALFEDQEINLESFKKLSEGLLLNIASIPYREGRLQFDKVKGHKYILPLGLNSLNALVKDIIEIEELHEKLQISVVHSRRSSSNSKYSLSREDQRFVLNNLSFWQQSEARKHSIYKLSDNELDKNCEELIKNSEEVNKYIADQKQKFQNHLRQLREKGFFEKVEKSLRQFYSLLYKTVLTLETSYGQEASIIHQTAEEVLFKKKKEDLEDQVFFILAGAPLKILSRQALPSFQINLEEEDQIIEQTIDLLSKRRFDSLNDLASKIKNDNMVRNAFLEGSYRLNNETSIADFLRQVYSQQLIKVESDIISQGAEIVKCHCSKFYSVQERFNRFLDTKKQILNSQAQALYNDVGDTFKLKEKIESLKNNLNSTKFYTEEFKKDFDSVWELKAKIKEKKEDYIERLGRLEGDMQTYKLYRETTDFDLALIYTSLKKIEKDLKWTRHC